MARGTSVQQLLGARLDLVGQRLGLDIRPGFICFAGGVNGRSVLDAAFLRHDAETNSL